MPLTPDWTPGAEASRRGTTLLGECMSTQFDWIQLARRWIPRRIRYAVQDHVSLHSLKLRYRRSLDPLADVLTSDDNRAGSPLRFGIVRNAAQYHSHYVKACLEMGVPFRVIDLYAADWLERVEASGCDALLLWPDAVLSIWSTMIKDRVEVLERELGYPVVPSSREVWMYEDKRRMAYWLAANRVPHPRTWVFYDRDEAHGFADSCELPVVFKTSFGASASGVRIVASRRALRSLVRRAFGRGITPGGTDWRDRQWGSLILQEYLPEVREWRMVRIGNSYFGHPKGRVGEFHSGSGAVEWTVPEDAHLTLLHELTERAGFRSMNVDMFETGEGRLLVNELQAVFGASYAVDQLRVNDDAGRFVRAASGWRFERGDFARNACTNLRIEDALARGLRRRARPEIDEPSSGLGSGRNEA